MKGSVSYLLYDYIPLHPSIFNPCFFPSSGKTLGEHANSTQKGPRRPGIEPTTFEATALDHCATMSAMVLILSPKRTVATSGGTGPS